MIWYHYEENTLLCYADLRQCLQYDRKYYGELSTDLSRKLDLELSSCKFHSQASKSSLYFYRYYFCPDPDKDKKLPKKKNE